MILQYETESDQVKQRIMMSAVKHEIFAGFAVDGKTANLSSRKLVSFDYAYFTMWQKSTNFSPAKSSN